MSSSIPTFDKLNSTNYNSWNGDMEAWYHAQALWRLISGASKSPTVSTPAKEGRRINLRHGRSRQTRQLGLCG